MKRLFKILPFVSVAEHNRLKSEYKAVLKHNQVFAYKGQEVRDILTRYDDQKIGTGKMVALIRDLYFG